MTPVNAGDDVIMDFDQGGFGGVILAIRRLNRGEEVMSDGMMSESGINGALEDSLLVFTAPVPLRKFQGSPLNGVVKYRESGKICDFHPRSPFISETVRHRPIVTVDH